MSNKFRLRRWLFGKNRKNVFVKFLAKQSLKNIRHYENEDRNHIRNGEFWLQKTLLIHFKTKKIQPTIFDVGANNGDWALNILKIHPEVNLHCFEPSENTFSILTEKLSAFTNVKSNKFGLSKKQQIIEFFENDAPDVTSLYRRFNARNDKKIKVSLVNGDKYIIDNNIEEINFLKIDIEGMEYDALLGLKASLNNKTIQLIQFEYGEFNIHSEKMLKHFYELLPDYYIGKLYPNDVEFQDWCIEMENFRPANIIAINKSCDDLLKLFNR